MSTRIRGRLPVADRPCDTPECDQVRAWRFDRLIAAGFDPGQAATVAANPSFDLHAVLDLIDRGCPPPLAARIVAPLETGEDGW
jgi:hypothetical protein